ncbi:unnamed protein product [Nesidiocoris tenuis]|uniref:BTB domain-containing protein n=1 Tax=Nesidiocoris tenuis TaxID=355587 RepID=A0A6H5GXS5_9HEMI|nr:unnamed protein product [Nesidiocoris tenuis]
MRLLLDFIYTGGAAVPEERLDSFLKAADTLQVTVLRDKSLHSHWKVVDDKRPVPCLVPLRPTPPPPQLGIITPCPWAGSARPSVGPPRRPLSSPHRVGKTMISTPRTLKSLHFCGQPLPVKRALSPEQPSSGASLRAIEVDRVSSRTPAPPLQAPATLTPSPTPSPPPKPAPSPSAPPTTTAINTSIPTTTTTSTTSANNLVNTTTTTAASTNTSTITTTSTNTNTTTYTNTNSTSTIHTHTNNTTPNTTSTTTKNNATTTHTNTTTTTSNITPTTSTNTTTSRTPHHRNPRLHRVTLTEDQEIGPHWKAGKQ